MTLADILARNFNAEEFLRIDLADIGSMSMGMWSEVAIARALQRLQAADIAKLRVVWGHYGPGVAACLPRPCGVVTILRDPLDRIVSGFYYHGMGRGDDWTSMLDEYVSRDFLKDLGLDNYMIRVLSGSAELTPVGSGTTTEHHRRVTEADLVLAAANLDRCLLVGVTDRFDEALLVLGSDLRWSLSDLVYRRQNVTTRRPAVEDIAPSIRDKIMDWNRYDAALVVHARKHLERRISAYPGDFDRDLTLFRQLNTLFQQGLPMEELCRKEYAAR